MDEFSMLCTKALIITLGLGLERLPWSSRHMVISILTQS